MFNVGIMVHPAMNKARALMHIIKSVGLTVDSLPPRYLCACAVSFWYLVRAVSSTCYPDRSDLPPAAVDTRDGLLIHEY